MRLYTKTGAAQVDDPEYGSFTPDANGAFELPDAMAVKLHGRPGWENDPERELRITKEELDRFRDPAELLKAVKELGANQGVLASAIASALGLTQRSDVATGVPTPVDAPEVKTEAPAVVADAATTAEATVDSPAWVPDAVQGAAPEAAPVQVEDPAPVPDVKPKAARRGKSALAVEPPPGE